jgi:hypothetical protein
MKSLAAVAAFLLVSGAAVVGARAQETPAPTPAPAEADDLDNEPVAPRHHIQVLQNPYDISSFYRSSQGSSQDDFAYEPSASSEKYPIAGFYRAGARGRYSMFWTNGYGRNGNGYGNGMGQVGGRGLIGARRSHALGLNGDLCLFAPTFLAPVGPLTGVFFER